MFSAFQKKSAFQSYDDRYHTLKQSESWLQIIDLTEELIASCDLTSEQQALALCRQISCYFYVNNHATAFDLSKKAIGLAQSSQSNTLIARSYYLASACCRALAPKQSGDYPAKSIHYIVEAIKLIEVAHNVDQDVKAKVYFNAGATFHDIDSIQDLAKAELYYHQAIEFQEADSDDLYRTQMRLARCLMQQCKLDEAESLIADIKPEPGTKTYVHLLLLNCRVAMKGKKFKAADEHCEEGLQLSASKGMMREQQMFSELNTEIKQALSTQPSLRLSNVP